MGTEGGWKSSERRWVVGGKEVRGRRKGDRRKLGRKWEEW